MIPAGLGGAYTGQKKGWGMKHDYARWVLALCLIVAVPSPIDVDLLQKLNFILKRNIAAVEAPRQRLEEVINRRKWER